MAYDDLFKSDKNAHSKSASSLKGWFKTKTGVGAKVAEKMATTFKSLSSYADFSDVKAPADAPKETPAPTPASDAEPPPVHRLGTALGLTYRIEVHLPDTTNVDTFRAIFRAIREELT